MLKYYALFAAAMALCFALTPVAYGLAHKFDALDTPTHRKVHKTKMPLWGGLAIFFSFFAVLGLYILFSKTFGAVLNYNHGVYGGQLFGVFTAGSFIMAMGMLDDKFGMPPKVKFAGQIVCALILINAGVRIYGINIPFTTKYLLCWNFISYGVTIFWVVRRFSQQV